MVTLQIREEIALRTPGHPRHRPVDVVHCRTDLYLGATVWRDTVSFGTYFLTYEVCKRRLLRYFDRVEQSSAGLLSMILAGGVAGVLAWGMVYPFDVIKVCTSPH